MSVSSLAVWRKSRKAVVPVGNTSTISQPPSSIEINMLVVPFYRPADDSNYQYVRPPTKRLCSKVMPDVAWQFGDQEVTIGEVVAMWSCEAGIMANAYINPLAVPAGSCTNRAAADAAEHLASERPTWVNPCIPTGDGAVYKTRGYAITDYEVTKIVMDPSNSRAVWKEPYSTPVTVMKFPHGKHLAWSKLAS